MKRWLLMAALLAGQAGADEASLGYQLLIANERADSVEGAAIKVSVPVTVPGIQEGVKVRGVKQKQTDNGQSLINIERLAPYQRLVFDLEVSVGRADIVVHGFDSLTRTVAGLAQNAQGKGPAAALRYTGYKYRVPINPERLSEADCTGLTINAMEWFRTNGWQTVFVNGLAKYRGGYQFHNWLGVKQDGEIIAFYDPMIDHGIEPESYLVLSLEHEKINNFKLLSQETGKSLDIALKIR